MASDEQGPQIVVHGIILKRDDDHIVIRIHPGLTVDVRAADVAEIEEELDELTQRAYVRVALKPDAELQSNFRPRLARLARAAEGRIPFAFGGESQALPPSSLPSGGARSSPPFSSPRGQQIFQRSGPGRPPDWRGISAWSKDTYWDTVSNTTVTTQTGTSFNHGDWPPGYEPYDPWWEPDPQGWWPWDGQWWMDRQSDTGEIVDHQTDVHHESVK